MSLDWDQPALKSKVLGKVPDDYYEHHFFGSFPSSPNPRSWSNVERQVPVLDATGKPEMHHVQKTWTDHGEPRVTWNMKVPIKDPELTGYSHYTTENSHYERERTFRTDDHGNTIYEDVKHIDGWQHHFDPDIKEKPTGYTFDRPEVSFYTGVNVLGRTALGVTAGAVLGAVSSGLLAAAYNRAMKNS